MIYRYCKLTKHQILYSTETFKETAIDEQIIAKSGSIEIISCTFSDFTTSSIIFSDSTSDIFVTKTLFRRSNSQDGFGLFNIDCNTALLDTNCITKCRSLNGINVGAISSKNEVAFNGTSITKSSENFEEAGKSLLNIQTDKLITFERNNISHNQVIEGYSGPSLLSQYFCIVKYCTFGYSKTGKILKIKNAELSTVNIVHNNSTRELIEAYGTISFQNCYFFENFQKLINIDKYEDYNISFMSCVFDIPEISGKNIINSANLYEAKEYKTAVISFFDTVICGSSGLTKTAIIVIVVIGIILALIIVAVGVYYLLKPAKGYDPNTYSYGSILMGCCKKGVSAQPYG